MLFLQSLSDFFFPTQSVGDEMEERKEWSGTDVEYFSDYLSRVEDITASELTSLSPSCHRYSLCRPVYTWASVGVWGF